MTNQPKDSASNSETKKKTPEQKLGDTPVAPWNMPTPEEKEEARPVRRALKEALKDVDSEEKADEVIQELEAAADGKTAEEVAQKEPHKPATITEAAQTVKQAAEATQAAPPGETAKAVLKETAKVIAETDGREREAVSEAVQEVLNPEQQGAPPTPTEPDAQRREFLRRAVLKRLKPLDALDANIFLMVNHLPHNRVLNGFFYFLTFIYNGGGAWFGMMALGLLLNLRRGWVVIRTSALPLTIATATVEGPIKAYFRRRRPFITIIQAIVIGKKPGTWSFPSGHSAAAFAGATLLRRYYPHSKPMLYLVASLVAFSRIYLGDHYPGDVMSGSLCGIFLSTISRRLLNPRKKRRKRNQPVD
jgi:membrane-associated phospholipid phosphatase